MRATQTIKLTHYPVRTHIPLLELLFEAQVRINMAYLCAHPSTPSVLRAGVRWRREGRPERWKDIPTILRDGHDDCEGLAAWRVAELRLRTKQPWVVKLKRAKAGLLHAVCKNLETGKTRDPSRVLGMKGAG